MDTSDKQIHHAEQSDDVVKGVAILDWQVKPQSHMAFRKWTTAPGESCRCRCRARISLAAVGSIHMAWFEAWRTSSCTPSFCL